MDEGAENGDESVRPAPGLRTGFSTGACAAAAAVAAWRALRGGDRSTVPPTPPGVVTLRFPDGRDRDLALGGVRREGGAAEAWLVKEAGDDPDITHGATLRARVWQVAPDEATPADFVELRGAARVILRGGRGVGRVTRRGLDVPPGKTAINPGPRRMILENLEREGLGAAAGAWCVEIQVDDGEALARKTLNPILGIEGGLSILGTSGLVIPCSNQAYLATIRILLRGARELGCSTAVLATGGRTHRSAQPLYPELPEAAFIRMGDFIRESVESAAAEGFKTIVSACMPGKLAKYARGVAYSHAHTTPLAMGAVADELASAGFPASVGAAARTAVSVREFLEKVDPETGRSILAHWAGRALAAWRAWAPACRFEIAVFDNEGQGMGRFA
jgi:cobalt-precorrin-5B (C1)-methyltransferase